MTSVTGSSMTDFEVCLQAEWTHAEGVGPFFIKAFFAAVFAAYLPLREPERE